MIGRENASATERALFDRIHDDPSDTTARLVFADWLLEQGRIEGEFIRLQCDAAVKPLVGRRMRRLRELMPREREWLGPVAAALDKGNRRYDRGFLSYGSMSDRHPGAIDTSLGHRAWGLVRELGGASNIDYAALLSVLDEPMLRWLHVLGNVTRNTFIQLLLDRKGPRIDTLQLSWLDSSAELRTALEEGSGLPNLRHLALGSSASATDAATLLETKLGQRLESLTVAGVTGVAGWHGAVIGRGPKLTTLRLHDRAGVELRFERGADGTWHDVAIRGGLHGNQGTRETVFRALATLHEGTIRRLHIETRSSVQTTTMDRIRKIVGPRVDVLERVDPTYVTREPMPL